MHNDENAWSELYAQTARETYFIALKATENQHDAQDLTQETYIIAMERLQQLADSSKFLPWLHMITANRCRDYLKKKRPSLFSDLVPEDGPELDWEADQLDVMPEQVLDTQETVRLVQEILETLPDEQKLCLILYYRDELSVGQIAQALETSEGTVKSRLNYARQKVKAKVLELEQQGTKLYGLSPVPFLLWLLHQESQSVSVPAISSIAIGSATAAAAGSGAAASGSTGIGSTVIETAAASTAAKAATVAAATGWHAFRTSAVAKILAGFLAAGTVTGGVAGVHHAVVTHQAPAEHSSASVEMEITPSGSFVPTSEAPDLENSSIASGTISTGEPESAENITAAETEEPDTAPSEVVIPAAYDQLLQCGYTDDHTPIRSYALLDLNDDGVPEMLTASEDMGQENFEVFLELLTIENGNIICPARFHLELQPDQSNNLNVYVINGRYLRVMSYPSEFVPAAPSSPPTSISHWTADFYSFDESFYITDQSRYHGNGITACTYGMTPEEQQAFYAEEKPLTQSELDYYRLLPWEADCSSNCFAQRAEAVEWNVNPYPIQNSYILTCPCFTVALPCYWEDVCDVKIEHNRITIYEKNSHAAGPGGLLLPLIIGTEEDLFQKHHLFDFTIVKQHKFETDGPEYKLVIDLSPYGMVNIREGEIPKEYTAVPDGKWIYEVLSHDADTRFFPNYDPNTKQLVVSDYITITNKP